MHSGARWATVHGVAKSDTIEYVYTFTRTDFFFKKPLPTPQPYLLQISGTEPR